MANTLSQESLEAPNQRSMDRAIAAEEFAEAVADGWVEPCPHVFAGLGDVEADDQRGVCDYCLAEWGSPY